ncbi:MAG: hypothetical protein R3225_07610 [Halofilum sp. (in: g-proteobacteria)]|nr:hypothetical protein [Halofilum sp. (in: g-proteobacteria)]
MTTEDHDEGRIRRALVAAVESLEGPDRGRMARIEQQLLARQPRRRTHPWWWAVLGLGLAAGAASAYLGWYARPGGTGAAGADESPVRTYDDRPVETSGAGEDAGEQGEGNSRSQDDEDPIIYIGQ